MTTAVMSKTPISIRLDDDLLAMLEKLQTTRGTMYYDRDRTWLIEEAIRLQYAPVVEKMKENGGGKPPQ